MRKIFFDLFTPGGPKVAHHVGAIINNQLYVHGGQNSVKSSKPLNQLHKFSFEFKIWTNITTPSSPYRSYHACVAKDNRYLVLIGGWDGKNRRSDVNVYDTVESKWLDVTTLNFPKKSGLSSHTANMQEDGRILVIGREGFERTPTVYTSVFTLRGVIVGDVIKFTYDQIKFGFSSRAGHCASIMLGQAFVVGGRVGELVQALDLRGMKGFEGDVCSLKLMSKRIKKKKLLEAEQIKITDMKYHSGLLCDGGSSLMIFGGWDLRGQRKEPLDHMYLLTYTPPLQLQWYDLGPSNLSLGGHVMVTNGKHVYIQGGEGVGGNLSGSLYEMKIKRISKS